MTIATDAVMTARTVEVVPGLGPEMSTAAPPRVSARTSPTSLQLRCVREGQLRQGQMIRRGQVRTGTRSAGAATLGRVPVAAPAGGNRESTGPAAVVAGLAGQLARLPFAALGEVLGAGRAALGWAGHAVEVGVGLPQRVEGLLDDASHLISSVGEVVAAARETTTGAHQVVCEAATTSRSAAELVALWEPLARDAAPLAQRFVDDLSGAEVNAAIKLVDPLPLFTEAM